MTTPADLAVARQLSAAGPWLLRVDPDGPTVVPAQAAAVPAAGIDGHVPGAVHDDLRRAGLIPDPFVDANEDLVAWASRTDWIYETELPAVDLAGAERADLVFGGIDTAARIELGGELLGRTRNMHRSYRFDVTRSLRAGRRDLAVRLTSAYTEAEALRDWVGPRPNAYPEPFNFIRKMACSFGWDWGITLPGAGIWRPVTLQVWTVARISHVRPLPDVDQAGDGVLQAVVEVERTAQGAAEELVIEAALDGATVTTAALPPGISRALVTAPVPDVRRWSPVGYGDAHLYDLVVTLTTRDGRPLDAAAQRIGFRHIRLDRSPDAAGSSFVFRRGGEPVLVKGVNWIPGDVLPGLMTRERYRVLLQAAVDAHVNLIRVWGGGLYETDEFYEICDELGLLVWQDFPFACAAYPEVESLRTEIRAEAEENVARLARHPSLVLWNGNNECDWLRTAEDWAAQPGGERDWGQRYYHEDLPEIVHRVDPTRPYTVSSPWSGHPGVFPNAPSHGTFHSWDVWNRQDYAHYRDSVPRFVSEFGWQAPPAWRTLRDAVTGEPLLPTSPGVLRHQKATGGMEKLAAGLAPHVRPRVDVDAWHYLTQWNQVRAIETGIRHWRAHWPVTTGTILWQLNDLWPVISWSAIDGAGRRKPLYFALRELYAPRGLAIEPGADGGLMLAALNDTDDPWTGTALIRRVSDAGFDSARRTVPVAVAPRDVTRISMPADVTAFGEPASEVLLAEFDGRRSWWYAAEPVDSAFVGGAPRIEARPIDGGLAVTVTATTLLRDFLIQPDRMHPSATADRGFVTLLPGESATITVSCPEPLDASALDVPWATAFLDDVIRR
jgi:beta-mannosidase